MSKVFVAGNEALDFVGTVAERGHARLEELPTAADLAEWFVLAGIVDEQPAVSAEEHATGIALREALYRSVGRLVDGQPPIDADRTLLNTIADGPRPAVTLDERGRRHRSGSSAQCLAAVAAAGIDLYDRTDGARVRWCADERCTHPFLDRSRNKQRRWCDMATCGDRAKVRAYRSRRTPDPA